MQHIDTYLYRYVQLNSRPHLAPNGFSNISNVVIDIGSLFVFALARCDLIKGSNKRRWAMYWMGWLSDTGILATA